MAEYIRLKPSFASIASTAKPLRINPGKPFLFQQKSTWRRSQTRELNGLRCNWSLPLPDRNKKRNSLFFYARIPACPSKRFEFYSLRWSIEVYFKEVKQHLGLLKEQSGHYVSIHLPAIRYLLLSHMLMIEGDGFLGTIRERIKKSLQLLSFATLLLELFKALIFGTLDQLQSLMGDEVIQSVKDAIDGTVTGFLTNVLQLNPDSMLQKERAVKAGVL